MTEPSNALVVRVEAHLTEVTSLPRSGSVRLEFLARMDGPSLARLMREQGAACMLGVLFEHDTE